MPRQPSSLSSSSMKKNTAARSAGPRRPPPSHHPHQQQRPQATSRTNHNNNNNNNKEGMVNNKAMNTMMKKSTDSTVFVKFLPPTMHVRRHHLEQLFSQIGPIKKCSVICQAQQQAQQAQKNGVSSSVAAVAHDDNDPSQQSLLRIGSYGFVKYLDQCDAMTAATQLNGQKLHLPEVNETVRLKVEVAAAHVATAATATSTETTKPAATTTTTTTNAASSSMRTAPTPVEPKTTKTTKKPMALPEDDHDNDHKKGSGDTKEDILKKHCRVILRNLSFYAKEIHIRQVLEQQFGPIVDIHLPTVVVPNTTNTTNTTTATTTETTQQHRGFAFVTFAQRESAEKCVAAAAVAQQRQSQGILIKNRPVRIEYSLDKNTFEKKQSDKTSKKKPEPTNTNPPQQQEPTRDEEEMMKGDEDENNNDDDDDDDSQSGDNSDEEVGDDDNDDDTTASEDENDNNSKDDDEGDDDDDNDDDNKHSEKEVSDHHNHNDHHATAVREKRTLFVRNLPFDVTRHDLFEIFRTNGHIATIYLVRDPTTQLPKGTAFVTFDTAAAASRALRQAAVAVPAVTVAETTTTAASSATPTTTNPMTSTAVTTGAGAGGSGLVCKGRHIYANLAVDKETAQTLVLQKDETKNGTAGGKDKRHLYLKNEGRVDNGENAVPTGTSSSSSSSTTAWNDLPPGDQEKRQRAWSEKNTKLRAPIFSINPHRISLRNLAKNVDEVMLKRLVTIATQRGMGMVAEGTEATNNDDDETKGYRQQHHVRKCLVTAEDQIAHWKASGTMTTREILAKIEELSEQASVSRSRLLGRKEEEEVVSIIPRFDPTNIKKYIPSVFVVRDFDGTKKSNEGGMSRGFAFVEFAEHAHALACLRELNNNPRYTAEYVTGGKHSLNLKAQQARRQAKNNGKKGSSSTHAAAGDETTDGKVRIPRLIVEFTVENVVKAKQQVGQRMKQRENAIKQKLEHKVKRATEAAADDAKEGKKGRGSKQREKKRQARERAERGEGDDEAPVVEGSKRKRNDGPAAASNSNDRMTHHHHHAADVATVTASRVKAQKPPKKKSKADPEDQNFAKMVESYKRSFADNHTPETVVALDTTTATDASNVPKVEKNPAKGRWFQE